MDGKKWTIVLLILTPVIIDAWSQFPQDDERRFDRRRAKHSHTKRHMLSEQDDRKSRRGSNRGRDSRKKSSGYLTPLKEDDMDNDEVISVAIGPTPIRPKYEKFLHKPPNTSINNSNITPTIIKDIFVELGREFLTRQVSEDFVFGQYVANTMKNLTSEAKFEMQHEVINLIAKYRRPKEEMKMENEKNHNEITLIKEVKPDKKLTNDTVDDTWPDFTNLSKL